MADAEAHGVDISKLPPVAGVTEPGAPTLAGGDAEECGPKKQCGPGDECPRSPTCNHIFREEVPPKYWYTVNKVTGDCFAQLSVHCKVCFTSTIDAAKRKVTFREMMTERDRAKAVADEFRAAYMRFGGASSRAAWEAGQLAEWAEQYWNNVVSAIDDAELHGVCNG
jgi:hypothetical protein